MKIADFRKEIEAHNVAHPEIPKCIAYNCVNKIDPAWDNQVLCKEHEMVMLYWFYEENGVSYCPDVWSFPDGKKLRKLKGSDATMIAYRKRYCDWIAALTPQQYIDILKIQIGDEEK